MPNNNYLSVIQFQLELKIKCDNLHNYIVADETYHAQMKKAIAVIQDLNPDVVVFPEMSYHSEYDETLRKLSCNEKLIVFGSTYIDGINTTMVFENGKLKKVKKQFACGIEPMVRVISKIDAGDFLKEHLSDHEFHVKGNKVYVLNCREYYETAYMIARNPALASDLFGFIVPCSNSNTKVFLDESRALHNHNEYVYSFVCNTVKNDNSHKHGQTYIFGPIQSHEKAWLKEEGILSDSHNSSILILDPDTPSYVYGKFACGRSLSRFGRSDSYIHTPQNITIQKLF